MYKIIYIGLLAGCAVAEISDKDRSGARIQYDLGVDNFNKGNVTGALAALSQGEKLDPGFADVQNALGLVYLALDKYDESVAHFKRALLLKANWSEARNNLGTAYMAQQKYDAAIEEFKAAAGDVLYATPFLAEGNLGYALYKKGEPEIGIKHIKNATLVNTKFCRGYMWLGEIYQQESNWREAERYLDHFVERCVLDSNVKLQVDAFSQMEVYMRLGQVEAASGNLGRARASFESCLKGGQDIPYYETCDRGLKQLQ
jgi:Tfp pilus assembly protein PilF